MYVSDKPNYTLVQILLESLQQEFQRLLESPDGTNEHPATTCLELWLSHPEYSNGQLKRRVSSTTFSTHIINDMLFDRVLCLSISLEQTL